VNKLGDAARVAGNDLVVSVRVTPRAKHNEVGDVVNGMLQVRTTAPPADGKANKAVIKLLAGFIGVAPSRIQLLRGAASRNKQFVVTAAANGL
jgi:uncharacterized protein (TIGR00251 family)